MRTLLGFLRPFWWLVTLSIIAGFFAVGASIGLMATSGYLIAKAALHPETVLLLWVPIVGVRFFGLSRAVFRYLERLASHDVTFRILAHLRVFAYSKIEPLAPALFVTKRTGDLLATLVADIDTLQNFFLRIISPAIIFFLSAALSFVIVGQFSVRLGVALISSLLIGGIVVPGIAFLAGRTSGKVLVELRAKYYALTLDLTQGVAELLAFGRYEQTVQTLTELQINISRHQRFMSQLNGMSTGVLVLINHVAIWVSLVIAIPLVATGKIPGYDLPVIALTALASFETAASLPQAYQYLSQTLQAFARVDSLVQAKSRVNEEGSAMTTWYKPDLVIRDVHFCYESSEAEILSGFDLDLPFGKHVAIVGESGAGKSTIVQLLLRFYEYEQGSIQLCGKELRTLDAIDVRSCFSVVEQGPHVFQTTLTDNLRVANKTATADQFHKAVEISAFDEVVQQMVAGYDTLAGEFGARLSGGEAKRLAIARAILADGDIFLIDEPTSGLDNITAARVIRGIEDMARDRSLVMITHRLIGLEGMDEILVIHDGKVVERGTHEQLLDSCGRYRALFDLQQMEHIIDNAVPSSSVLAPSVS